MILNTEEVKTYLRLEPEFTDDDDLIATLIDAAEAYLLNATGLKHDSTNALARLLAMTLVADWYENREMTGKASESIRFVIESILAQLQYAPEAEDAGETL